MAYATMSVTNGIEVKKVPLGFSWTTLFFGGIPALLRQDWIWGICIILACMATYGVAGIFMAFIYNKTYAKNLFSKGYKLLDLPAGYSESHVKEYLGFVNLPIANRA